MSIEQHNITGGFVARELYAPTWSAYSSVSGRHESGFQSRDRAEAWVYSERCSGGLTVNGGVK